MFAEESDVNKVLLGKPWSFDKYLVVLKRIERSLEVKSLVLVIQGCGYGSMISLSEV